MVFQPNMAWFSSGLHLDENVVTLTKCSTLQRLYHNITTSGAASNEEFVTMMPFSFHHVRAPLVTFIDMCRANRKFLLLHPQ